MRDDSGRRPLHVMLLVVSPSVGGAETHALTLARGLASQDFTVSLVYLKDEDTPPDPPPGMERIRTLCLNAGKGLDLGAVRRLAAYAAANGVDVAVCANPYPLLYAWALRLMWRRRLPVVEILHSSEPFTRGTRLQMLVYRPLMWMSDLLVFVCRSQRNYWEDNRVSGRRSEVVHNGVDLSHFRNDFPAAAVSALRQSHGFADGDYVVGVCGILRPEKGHLDLIEAVGMARASGTAVKCLIIGDGPMRGAVEDAIRAASLEPHVAITGLLADVRLAVSACDTIVIPSHNETFSVAALEAMALGKPLIMSNVGGAPELVEHAINGFLYPKADVRSLSNRIRLLADPARRAAFGQASLAKVSSQFCQSRMIEAYARCLTHLRPG